MLDALALIEKHQSKGVLVDTNLLVLFLVGLVNRQRIVSFKRTQNFTVHDFDLLARLIGRFGKLYATPHVLSQVSDLTKLPGKELREIRSLFKLLVEKIEESYEPSRVLATDPIFERLGLADAAITRVCSQGILVLTADFDLHHALELRGADALNFNHARQLGWN
ncbi:MAG: PIN domain-containing protein [Bryobacteraceae bacterium]